MNKGRILKVLFALVLLAGALGPVKDNASAASSRYFPETKKTVKDPFLAYWSTHGGLSQQGFPITETYDERNDADGKTYQTQYFERARFEYHPENKDPKFQVLLGLLGKEALTAKYGDTVPDTDKKVVPGTGSRTFPETGKTVNGLFLSYWQSHGGLEQQGFPITNAYEELNDADGQTYVTQYFERARFEYHPENGDPRFQVLLGLVGQEIYAGKAGNGGNGGTGGTATPPPPWAGEKIPTPLDTAFLFWTRDPSDTRAYFVKGAAVSIFDVKTNKLSVDSIAVQTLFPGLAYPSLTSVLAWPDGDPNYGLFFLYNGPVFSIYNIQTRMVVGAQPPSFATGGQYIPGPTYPVETFFTDMLVGIRVPGFDAVAEWPSNSVYKGKVLGFSDTIVDILDSKTHKEDSFASISTIFPGLPFDRDLDAVVPWPNGKVYFFKGDQYAVCDTATNKADPGYPRPIN